LPDVTQDGHRRLHSGIYFEHLWRLLQWRLHNTSYGCLSRFFGMTFTQAVSTTKLVNVVSSLSATIIFAWRGLVDYRLGISLGIIMFIGAYIGGHLTLKLSNLWLRRIFMAAVIALALKIAFHDFLLKMLVGK